MNILICTTGDSGILVDSNLNYAGRVNGWDFLETHSCKRLSIVSFTEDTKTKVWPDGSDYIIPKGEVVLMDEGVVIKLVDASLYMESITKEVMERRNCQNSDCGCCVTESRK